MAAFLMVPALAGCFTVSGPGEPDRAGERASPSAPERRTGPQGPRPPRAREDLVRTGPDAGRDSRAQDSPSPEPAAPAGPGSAAPPPASRPPRPAPAPERQPESPARPAPEQPRNPGPARRGGSVCDMGERYGRWAEGSEQERICRGVYG
ncbi:hypothetical protein [Streptomyces sp. NPDC048845]|uniref:hypothetical protein n=1 Tax=Streptomyces sp. NPDC048845 TaxID=3155390 RepID=UPI00342688F0